MHSTGTQLPITIYETLAEAAFRLADVEVNESVIRRTALTLARLSDGIGVPAALSDVSTDFMQALTEAAA